MPDGCSELVQQIFAKLEGKNRMIATAESCTGGMISSAITDESGSSAYFDRGFVTYSNEAKMEMLDVSAQTLKDHGAVSEKTAIEMVRGTLKNSNAKVVVSVTGIAGPSGGTDVKPVGLIYIGFGLKGGVVQAKAFNFAGMSRQEVRQNTTLHALKMLLSIV